MKTIILLGIAGALLTGILIGVQATLVNRTGQLIGPVRTGLLTNIAGGTLALLLLGVLAAGRVVTLDKLPNQAILMMAVAGLVGVFIVMGVSFSLRYSGVVAGLAAIILGQMLISTLVDTLGWIGLERIPLSWQRILGLILLAVAVYFLVPRE